MVAPEAAIITVAQTLALLDDRFASLAEAIAQGRYAFWLGSGISRDRVDDVAKLVRRILVHLQTRMDPHSADCRFRRALDQIIRLAELSAAESRKLNLLLPPDEWADLPTILRRLTRRYSEVLRVPVAGERPDYLLWDAVDVRRTYGECRAGPDCEHLCLVILVLEGVVTEMASANWDGLIEAAQSELSSERSVIQLCIRAEDLRRPRLQARLLKFHGCAVKARENEAVYRPLLIATQPQIETWATDREFAPMRTVLINLVVSQPTIMIGMSAQDGNIRNVFNQAKAIMRWEWPSDVPAYVFAEDELGVDQEMLLECVYRAEFAHSREDILQSATIRAYAKPLLTALVLHVLFGKLRALVEIAPAPLLDYASRAHLASGLSVLRDRAAACADGDRLAFVRELVRQVSWGLALFRQGKAPSADDRAYRPIGTTPVHRIPGDPMLEAGGQRELAVALALIGLAVHGGTWTVMVENIASPTAGALAISSGGRNVRVFFVAGSDAAVCLRLDGRVSAEDDDLVMVQSSNPAPQMSRSPSRARGRKGRPGPRIVGMAALLCDAEDAAGLMQRFREELSL